MDKLDILAGHIDRAASELVLLEPDDLQGLVALMDVAKEVAGAVEADGDLALFAHAADAIEAVLTMLVLFQIDSEEDKQHALSMVGESLDALQDVLRNLPADPGYTGNLGEVLERIAALTGTAPAPLPSAGEPARITSQDASGADADEPAEAAPRQGAGVEPVTPDGHAGEVPDLDADSPEQALTLDPSLEPSLVDEFVTEAIEHLDSIEENLLELEDNPENLEAINTIFRPFHTIKGVSGFLQLTPINRLAHETENLLDEARSAKLAVSPALIDVVLSSVDLINKMVAAVRDMNAAGGGKGPVFPIEPLIARIHRVLSGEETEVQSAPARENTGVTVQDATPQARAKAPTIKIDTDKLDSLLNMVGELVVAQLQVRQDPVIQQVADQRLQRNLAQLSRITNELQKTAMSTRMVPIRATFQKMVRVVRDLSKKNGKSVELKMLGADTEIDRNLVDEIYEPLMHMVRNSLDHGIETPEERAGTGKPPMAHVTLGAQHKGDAIIITIADDGRGLNGEKIRAKAIERGVIAEDDVLEPRELYNLIFQAGFSTADQVTDVSGRGVGMDVVVKAIEKVRGKVELDSTPGQGTTVTIRLPLTLAIIDGMVVKVGAERYIIPTLAIMESFKPEKEHFVTVNQQGEALKVRGKLLPLVRLGQVLGIDSDVREPWDGLAVVVESEGIRSCLMVDTLLGKQEIVIKSLGERMQGVDGVAGGAILGDGSIGLILDVTKLYRLAGIAGL